MTMTRLFSRMGLFFLSFLSTEAQTVFRNTFLTDATFLFPQEFLGALVTVSVSKTGVAYVVSDGAKQYEANALYFQNSLRESPRLLLRSGDLAVDRGTLTRAVFAGTKAVYFKTVCYPYPIAPTLGIGCTQWKIPLSEGASQRLVGFRDTVSFELLDGRQMRGSIGSDTIYPTLDGTRELAYLSFLQEGTTNFFRNGIFELRGGIFKQVVQPQTFNHLVNPNTGILSRDGILLHYEEYVMPPNDDKLIRYDTAKQKAQVLIADGQPFLGDVVSRWWISRDPETYDFHLFYDTSDKVQRLVSLAAGQPEVVLTTNQEIGSFGRPQGLAKIQASSGFALLALRYLPTQSFVEWSQWDALALADLRSKTFEPLVRVGDVLPNGKTVKRLRDFAVMGCEGAFLTADTDGKIDALYNISKPCIQQFPAAVQPEQEIVLQGQNFLVEGVRAENVDILLNGSIPVKPRRVSSTELAFLLPAMADPEVRVQVRLTHPTGVVTAAPVRIQIQQPPVTVLPVTGLTSAAGKFLSGPRSSFELASIFLGQNLGGELLQAASPYPLELGDIRALVNDQPAGVQAVSSFQVNVLLPKLVPGSRYRLVVERLNAQGAVMARSTPFEFEAGEASPDFFSWRTPSDKLLPKAQNFTQDPSGQTLVTEENPARPGDVLVMYGTGFGLMEPEIPYRSPAGSVLTRPVLPIRAFVAGALAEIEAVYSPEYPGVWQVALKLPPDLDASLLGRLIEVEVQVGSAARVTIFLPL